MKILNYPELRQSFDWDCGANAFHSVCMYYGIDVNEDEILKLAKTTKRGTFIDGMKAVAKQYGFRTKAGKMTIEDIKGFIDRKIPVILLVQAWTDKKDVDWTADWTDGHYVVAIGYDSKNIYFEDPAAIERTCLTHTELQDRWHDIDRNGKKAWNWGMAVYGKRSKYSQKNIEHMD